MFMSVFAAFARAWSLSALGRQHGYGGWRYKNRGGVFAPLLRNEVSRDDVIMITNQIKDDESKCFAISSRWRDQLAS